MKNNIDIINDVDKDKLLGILNNLKKLNVLVIGDTIIDEYKNCEPLGMSQEDASIVVAPESSDMFLGGAGIVASHASALGANVDFITILGDDEYAIFAENKLNDYNVNAHIYKDSTRITTLKQRFKADKKILLKINHIKSHHISQKIQDKILKDIENNIKNKDLLVFSDFSYGCLPTALIESIISLGLKYNIMMVADSQSSSQRGDISKFTNVHLATPTENEIRLSVNDFESNLTIVARKLQKIANIKNIFITLDSEGMLMYENSNNIKYIEALNKAPKDVAGAGDCLLISSSIFIASGASMVEGAYVGSLMASLQVGQIGNLPIGVKKLKEVLTQ